MDSDPKRRRQALPAPTIGDVRSRAWGSAHPRYWFPLDISRPRKDKLVVLDRGGFVHPAFSPDEPDRVIPS